MSTTSLVYGLLIAVGLLGAAGDVAVYHWSLSRNHGWLLLSWLLWIVSVTLFGVCFRYQHFSFGPGLVIALAIHAVTGLACDYLFYGQRLNRFEILGISLAAIAILILELARPQK